MTSLIFIPVLHMSSRLASAEPGTARSGRVRGGGVRSRNEGRGLPPAERPARPAAQGYLDSTRQLRDGRHGALVTFSH